MGIKIVDVKVVGICSKHRNTTDEIPKWKNGNLIEDKDLACIGCLLYKKELEA